MQNKLSWILALCWISLPSPAQDRNSGPHLTYSDLVSGPGSGGEDNLGAIVSMFGAGFGTLQGGSSVVLAGTPVRHILQWTEHKIVFQIDSSAQSGELRVLSNGRSSNPLFFTVIQGSIHFVSATGRDSAAGFFTSPWKSISKAAHSSKPGDITYVMDGVSQTTLDSYNAALSVQTSGQAHSSIALVAYPGADAVIGDISGSEFGVRTPAIHAGPFNNWVIAGFVIRGANTALKLDGVSGWRVVNNDFSCPSGDGAAACVEVSGSTRIAFLGNLVHDAGRAGSSKRYQSVYFTTDSNHIEVGWNTITNNSSCRGIQFHSSPVSAHSGFNQYDLSIHDNRISGQTCDGLNLATIDPSKGRIAVFNNVIYHVGTGPPPPDGDSSYACINSPGIVNHGTPGSGSVEIFNNTLADCGSQGGPSSGALNVGPNSPNLELNHNVIYQCAGRPYFTHGSELGRVSDEENLWQGNGPEAQQTATNLKPGLHSANDQDSSCAAPEKAERIPAENCRIDHDITGAPRNQGGSCSIGAFE